MSGQPLPITGDSDDDWEARAALVADMAWTLREESPQLVWERLTATKGGELQRLLMVALAAFPVDRTLADAMDWVTDLPAARFAS